MTFPDNFRYKTTPFPHQKAELEGFWKRRARALFWEMGTGKTKPVLDNAAAAYHAGAIDALVVIATNGVHRGWAEDEIPAHLHENVNPKVMVWDSKRAKNMATKREFSELLKHEGLAIFTMSYHSINTKGGKDALNKILANRKCFLVADESAHIKTPSAQWTKTLTGQGAKWRGLAEKAVMRRIMTGTPITQGPFDAYSQLRFLKQEIWKEEHGLHGFSEFKSHFGVFETGYRRVGDTLKEYPILTEHRNLEQLEKTMNEWGSRVLKADVFPDLPPKMYQKRRFELGEKNRKLYEQMRNEYKIELASGERLTAPQAMTRVIRLHQIGCGNIPTEDGTVDIESLGEKCARMETLLNVIDECSDKMIIWAHFRDDTARIMRALKSRGIPAVLHDGGVPQDDREANIKAFRTDPAIRCFVATPATISEGRTLNEATLAVYYSQDFNLKNRLQSEDRCHRSGQHNSVLYIDLVAEDTVDEKIITSLLAKKNLANLITGDKFKEWI